MYRRTVLRASPTRRAIAQTVTPCRCSSRIITISPSRTNDAPLCEKGTIIAHRGRSPPRGLPGQLRLSSPGKNSTGTFGEYSAGTHTYPGKLGVIEDGAHADLLVVDG